MFNKLPIEKEYLLIAATILLLVLCYQFAFKNTIAAWQTLVQLQQQVAHTNDLSVQPDYLKRKNLNLDKILDQYRVDTVEFRSNSISKIAIIAEKENVKLSEIPLSDPVFHTDKFIIQKFDLEGDYFSLTKALNSIRSTNGIGMIRSVTYKLVRGRAIGDDKKLIAEVYLEIAK